jgi:hypothetical protein
VVFLLFKNPTRDLRPVEHELPYAPDPEVRESAHEIPLPNGPDGASEEPGDLADRERLAQSICRALFRYGFCYGQFCPRLVGPNSLELLRFCVFAKLDLCHLDRPYFSRAVCVRSLRKELPLTVHHGAFLLVPSELLSETSQGACSRGTRELLKAAR